MEKSSHQNNFMVNVKKIEYENNQCCQDPPNKTEVLKEKE